MRSSRPAYDTKTSTVVVTLEMEEQQLAADVLNAIVGEVDRFMRLKRINTATEQVRWISTRLGGGGEGIACRRRKTSRRSPSATAASRIRRS